MVDLASILVAHDELEGPETAAVDNGEPAGRIRLLARKRQLALMLREYQAELEQDSTLEPLVREIAVLCALRRSRTEVAARLPTSKKHGISGDMVEAILDEDWTDPSFGDKGKAAFQFALQFDAGHLVNDSVLEALRAQFSDEGIVELALLCGYFGTLARLAVGFRLDSMET